MARDFDKKKFIREITEAGYPIENINDLMNIGPNEQYLTPIILKYLTEIDDGHYKGALARAMTVKGYKGVAPVLIEEFKKDTNDLDKWAIGNALCFIQDESVLDDMIELVKDKKYGTARQMIAEGLGAYKTDEVKETLISLLDDEDVNGHALHALGVLKDESTRKYVERFLDYDVTWIRNKAKTIIKRLDKQKEKEEAKRIKELEKQREKEERKRLKELEKQKKKEESQKD